MKVDLVTIVGALFIIALWIGVLVGVAYRVGHLDGYLDARTDLQASRVAVP